MIETFRASVVVAECFLLTGRVTTLPFAVQFVAEAFRLMPIAARFSDLEILGTDAFAGT